MPETSAQADHRPTARDEAELVPYLRTLDCIHCGLCLQTCPTYRMSGVETSSPRGRVHLMRAVGEGRLAPDAAYREELDYCLLCRHCESVCPAGVRFGELMEVARDRTEARTPRPLLARLARHAGLRWVLPHRLVLRALGTGLRLVQRLGLDRLVAGSGRRGAALASLPRIAPGTERAPLPRETPAAGGAGGGAGPARVAVLEGCVQPELFPNVGRATLRSLARLGIASVVPREAVCCGSLHAHNGDLDGARRLARQVLAAFESLTDERGEPLPIVMNSAGCGAHLRELGNLFPAGDPLHARAEALARRVVDYSELVAERLAAQGQELDGRSLEGPLTWDDPCHLCHGQGVRRPPRAILERLRDAEVAPLPRSESCCGSAGLYAFLRPADAQRVFHEKLADLAASGARTLVTANPGCQLQWESGLRRAGVAVRVMHLAEVVERGLAGDARDGDPTPASPDPGLRSGS